MSRLLALRRENHSRRRRLILAVAAVSCLVIAAAIVSAVRYGVRKQPNVANIAVVSETVNLWDAGTLRGEQPNPLQSVSLPAALVRVSIILPRFGEPGQYAVAVTRDRTGSDVLAQASAHSISDGNHDEVFVVLNLQKAKTGPYFLSTTHEQDQASYYYPLQIR